MKKRHRDKQTLYDFENSKSKRQKEWRREHAAGGFRCGHCKGWVSINDHMGTANRNHCNVCLWSKHVDRQTGDRKAACLGGMRPIALTFKHEGWGRQGEIMLVHECAGCDKVWANRIARDDSNDEIVAVFERSLGQAKRARTKRSGMTLLVEENRDEVLIQLFGHCPHRHRGIIK